MSTQPVPASDGTSVPVVADVPVGHNGARVNVRERAAFAVDGFVALAVAVALVGFVAWRVVVRVQAKVAPDVVDIAATTLALLLVGLILSSLIVIAPGQSRVVQFFGRYVGTARRTGLTVLMAPLDAETLREFLENGNVRYSVNFPEAVLASPAWSSSSAGMSAPPAAPA